MYAALADKFNFITEFIHWIESRKKIFRASQIIVRRQFRRRLNCN